MGMNSARLKIHISFVFLFTFDETEQHVFADFYPFMPLTAVVSLEVADCT